MTIRPRKIVTPKARNGFQVGTAGITGAAIFGSLAATGWVTGVAAKAYGEEQAARAIALERAAAEAPNALAPKEIVVEKRRPYKTVVETTVVDQVGAPQATTPGAGGTVTNRSSVGSRNQSGPVASGSGSSSGKRAQPSVPKNPPAPAAAPAPQLPPPAPSSGS